MRYQQHQKEATRQKIIDVAARLFKVHGTDATGIATIMAEAGLTNGAFYAHFTSKEALFEAVIADQLHAQLETIQKALKNEDGLRHIIDLYLSQEHLVSCAEGCPSAALLGDISKHMVSSREAYTTGLKNITHELAKDIEDSSHTTQRALALVGLLVGTLQLARTVTDANLAHDILEGGRGAALRLLHNRTT